MATSDFLTTPESSYPMLAGEITSLGVPVREVLEDYLAKRSWIKQNRVSG